MKKLALALLASLALSTGAQALETGVAPKVTELGVSNPTTGLYVGNSYSFYNCGVHGYVRGLTRAANRTWKARLQTISSGMLSWHNVEDYLSAHEMDTYVVKDTDKMFDVVFLQGMSSEPIAAKRVPTFRMYLAKHVETIRSKGSVPVVVVTWAKADKMDKDTRRLADSIIEEANRNNAIALPVGLAFAESLKERPTSCFIRRTRATRPPQAPTSTARSSTRSSSRPRPKDSTSSANAKNPSGPRTPPTCRSLLGASRRSSTAGNDQRLRRLVSVKRISVLSAGGLSGGRPTTELTARSYPAKVLRMAAANHSKKTRTRFMCQASRFVTM